MLKRLLFSFLVFFTIAGDAQINLVPNPSLEDTVFCPWAENQMPYSWLCFGASPDYYNGCSSALNVPNTPTGFHPAHSGVGMIGVFTYVDSTNASWPNYREFVGVPLTTPLTIGQKYYLSYYLSYARVYPVGWNGIGTDKLGMKFSTIPYAETTPPLLSNSATLYTDSIYTDTTQWVKISGSFIADSTYSYVMLGNFFNDFNTDTLYFGGPPYWASSSYYFIDDICVSTDSAYNSTWTGLSESKPTTEQFVVSPNPATDVVNILFSNNDNEEVVLTNLYGEVISTNKINNNISLRLNISSLPSGIYILTVFGKQGKKLTSKKIVKL